MNKDIEFKFQDLRIKGAQLIEGLVIFIVFPLFLLLLRKCNKNMYNVMHYVIHYGLPVGLTWIVRRFVVNYYQDKLLLVNSN
jgi:phosphate starvation-inducible membrane PsiE